MAKKTQLAKAQSEKLSDAPLDLIISIDIPIWWGQSYSGC